MKTLHGIEQRARELAGGEFEVRIARGGTCVWVETDWLNASFDARGQKYIYIELDQPDMAKVARFVSLCSQLDTWMKVEICEYNPEAKRARYENEPMCSNPARWSVGARGQWHLCNNCAALPEFARMKRRVPLNRKDTP